MKDAKSVGSVGSLVEGAGTDMSKVGSPPSLRVSFLCLMMILRLSWLGEGRTVAFGSSGAVTSISAGGGGVERQSSRRGARADQQVWYVGNARGDQQVWYVGSARADQQVW